MLADRPHASPLAVQIHRNRHQQAEELDASNGQKDRARAIRIQPVHNEERKDQAVEHI